MAGVCSDTGGESALTQFLMSEVSRLQRALQDERKRRQQACSVAKEQVGMATVYLVRFLRFRPLTCLTFVPSLGNVVSSAAAEGP